MFCMCWFSNSQFIASAPSMQSCNLLDNFLLPSKKLSKMTKVANFQFLSFLSLMNVLFIHKPAGQI